MSNTFEGMQLSTLLLMCVPFKPFSTSDVRAMMAQFHFQLPNQFSVSCTASCYKLCCLLLFGYSSIWGHRRTLVIWLHIWWVIDCYMQTVQSRTAARMDPDNIVGIHSTTRLTVGSVSLEPVGPTSSPVHSTSQCWKNREGRRKSLQGDMTKCRKQIGNWAISGLLTLINRDEV